MDASELTAKWREELFGAHGSLTGRLATASATA